MQFSTDLAVYTFPEGAGVVAGKMVNVPETDHASITWYRATVEDGVNFQNKDGECLNAPKPGQTDIAVSKSPCTWTWNIAGYYTTDDSRTLLYKKETNTIKDYAVSNVSASTKNAHYSGFAISLSEYIDGEIANVRDLNGNIGTLCLEKKVIAFEGAKFYRVHSKDTATSAWVKNVTFEEITGTLEAGEACIFEPEDGETQIRMVRIGDAVATPLVGGLRGTFVTLDSLRGNVEGEFADIFFVINNKIHKAGDDAKLAPHRAYIDMSQVAYNAPKQSGRRYIVLGYLSCMCCS